MKKSTGIIIFLFIIHFGGCSSLTLRPVDFSWPIEVEAKSDSLGVLQRTRYQISFNVKPLLFEELRDSVKNVDRSFNIIRDQKGFYFITAKDFKNVYVFLPREGTLQLEKKIFISEKGLQAPSMNQRPPYIELVNKLDENVKSIMLSEKGIQ